MNRGVTGVFLLILAIMLFGLHIIQAIEFSQNCSGYIKQAADANTVELAISRLDKAIDYVERENLTTGYTSVIYKTESDNVEFWYQNLIACRAELENGKDGSQLEKTNLLLKIRESLTDSRDGQTVVTMPTGIARYPNNLFWGLILTAGFILVFLSLYCFATRYY